MKEDAIAIYLGSDNPAHVQLMQGDAPFDLSSTVRVDVHISGTVISSEDHPTWFDWTPDPAQGTLILRLGSAALDQGLHRGWIRAYTSGTPNGLYFGSHEFRVVRVGAAPE